MYSVPQSEESSSYVMSLYRRLLIQLSGSREKGSGIIYLKINDESPLSKKSIDFLIMAHE